MIGRGMMTLRDAQIMGDTFKELWRMLFRRPVVDRREDPLLAIEFARDCSEGHEVQAFLTCWSEGDWPALQREWPEWVDFMASKGIDVYFEPRIMV